MLLDAIRREWDDLRATHRLALRPPVLALHGGRARLGLWTRAHRVLSVSRDHALEDPWLDVRETVLHELAHQVVDELHGGEATPHGPVFQRTLERLGALSPLSAEEPVVVGRVRKLLALAGSPNRHEAQLAMARAQKLLIANRLERVRLDGVAGFVRRQLGEPRRRQASWRGTLIAVLGRHFDVEAVRVPVFVPADGTWATAWEIAGRREDVEMVDYAHAFVERTAESLWAAHLQRSPRAGRSRDRFLLGVVAGFRDTLDTTAEEARQEGLVLLRDPQLAAAWARRYPRLRATRGHVRADAHYDAGRQAGGDLVLHRPITARPGGGGLLEG